MNTWKVTFYRKSKHLLILDLWYNFLDFVLSPWYAGGILEPTVSDLACHSVLRKLAATHSTHPRVKLPTFFLFFLWNETVWAA